MAWVYILKSKINGRYYIGSTSYLERRLFQHKNLVHYSSKRFGEFDLVFKQEYPALKDARAVEKRLKSLKRRDYIEQIIQDGQIKLQL